MSNAERANEYADWIIKKKMSIREVARMYGVSKSTVHHYITNYTTGFFRKIRLKCQLRDNYEAGHVKGGATTKKKYNK